MSAERAVSVTEDYFECRMRHRAHLAAVDRVHSGRDGVRALSLRVCGRGAVRDGTTGRAVVSKAPAHVRTKRARTVKGSGAPRSGLRAHCNERGPQANAQRNTGPRYAVASDHMSR